MDACPKPKFIVLYQWKYLFTSYCVDIANDEEFLVVLNQERNELTKQGEWRIGDDNICLFQKGNALLGAKVSIALQILHLNFFVINLPIVVLVSLVDLINRLLASVLREQIDILVFVARGDNLLQPQHLKVQGEVAKEVGASWIVAITKNCLALEVMPIMFQLQFNVFQTSVELVLLRGLCLVQVFVRHLQILNARLLHIAQ